MNNINDLIEKIYINTVDAVLKDFDEKDYEFIKRKYFETLKSQYEGLEEYIRDYNKTYEKFYRFERNNWLNKSIDEKKKVFFDDLSLNQIIEIASIAYESAKNRLNNNILISKAYSEQLIDKLSWYLSESIVELNYSCGNTDNTSLRISHIR